MSKLKRVAAGGLPLLLALVLAAPARADVKGECVLDGALKLQDKMNAQVGMLLVGGGGKFGFVDGDALCTADTDKDGIAEGPVRVYIEASGWYDSLVCGTGKLVGTIDDVLGPRPKWQILEEQKFAIEFLNFVGVWFWHDWGKPALGLKFMPAAPPEGKDQPPEKDYAAAGGVVLVPDALKQPPPVPEEGECGKGFRMTGAVSVHSRG